MARRVKDEECVIMPNQFGMDHFDPEDAFGEQRENMCSRDLMEFIAENDLDTNNDGSFNPRNIFGSHSDSDHVYNDPRAWFMGRYLNPKKYRWDGENADFTPMSDDIPWSYVPERKVTIEDVKYLLSSHYQGTPYDPYTRRDGEQKGIYRPIGINRTGVMAICQIRGSKPEAVRGVEWICFGPTTFDTILPIYTNTGKIPEYLSNVSMDVSTENFYWGSRLVDALADQVFGTSIQHIERYQNAVVSQGRKILNEYDKKIAETGDLSLIEEANRKICEMAKKETTGVLNKVLLDATQHMKNGYSRADN